MSLRHRRCAPRLIPIVDRLDGRCLLSGLSPQQMLHAYGFDAFHLVSRGQSIKADGSGQAIALIEAYHDPNLINDLKAFDRYYGLPDPAITQYYYGTQSNDGWATEEMLDVEWAHVIAPGAKIIVVEGRTTSFADLNQAVDWARHLAGVVAVSMSYGSGEFSGESAYDALYTTPAGHNGLTFLASTGDDGAAPGAEYPAASPNVLAVGGTHLNIDGWGNYLGETGWSGSGGGYSRFEAEHWYQYRFQGSGRRTIPDVALDADPASGCWVYCTAPSTGRGNWQVVGGTSAAAPMWAGLIAIADQGRALLGLGPLDGATQVLPAIYASKMDGDFRDVARGSNGYSAGPGYDLVTGRGTPLPLSVVRDLMQVGSSGFASSADTPRPSATPARSTFDPMLEAAFTAHPACPPPVSIPAPNALPGVVIVPSTTMLAMPTDLLQTTPRSRKAKHHEAALEGFVAGAVDAREERLVIGSDGR